MEEQNSDQYFSFEGVPHNQKDVTIIEGLSFRFLIDPFLIFFAYELAEVSGGVDGSQIFEVVGVDSFGVWG